MSDIDGDKVWKIGAGSDLFPLLEAARTAVTKIAVAKASGDEDAQRDASLEWVREYGDWMELHDYENPVANALDQLVEMVGDAT